MMLTRLSRSKNVVVAMVLMVCGLLLSGCMTTRAEKGAALGTVLGAGIGAAIPTHRGTNALIGGGAGLLSGYVIGSYLDAEAGN